MISRHTPHHTLIIAEAGVNHNGDIGLAKKLVDAAAEAGADYVKFQTFKAEKLVSRKAEKAAYQKQTTEAAESQFEMIKKLEMGYDMHVELIAYCKEKGIRFLSTPFDLDSIDMLHGLGITLFKLPSGEINNLPYLRKIGGMGGDVILSSGMSYLSEIEMAIRVLEEAGTPRERISVLHCNTEYPTPMADVNLRAMNTIGQALHVPVGYSDHTLGIEIPIAAVARGARIIEKHFTLDKTMEGPDHKASLEPQELLAMVRAIRNIEAAQGDGIKQPSASEKKNLGIVRKSIHVAREIKGGSVIEAEDLMMMRPGDGLSPMLFDLVVGKKARHDLGIDHKLSPRDFE